jgi:hypothetical protein
MMGMGHSVQLIIGRGEAVQVFLRQWPGSRAVELRDGWQAIPVEDALYAAIEARPPARRGPRGWTCRHSGWSSRWPTATETGGGLAYVETEYFGGTGEQSAMAFVDGREADGATAGAWRWRRDQSGAASDRRCALGR